MKNTVTLAQIGCGYWGPNLLRNFWANNHCTVKWGVDASPERRTFMETHYPAVQTTDSWQTVLDDREVEAVVLATPAATHFELCRNAMQAGKHVFVEKPLAMSVADAEALVQLAEKTQRKLFVGHTFLYNAAVEKVKEYIDQQELGEIYYIYAQRLNLGRVRQDANAMWNLAPHDISIILYWLGEQPQHVSAKGVSFLQEGIEDVVFMNLAFPSGKLAHIHSSWLDPCKVRKIVVVGSRKMLVYDDTSADAKITLYDKGVDKKTMYNPLEPISSFGQFQLLQRTGDMVAPFLKFPEPLRVQTDHFLQCILNDTTPRSNGQNGLDVVRVLEAAQTSMRTQRHESACHAKR